jgi:hypothetical protein
MKEAVMNGEEFSDVGSAKYVPVSDGMAWGLASLALGGVVLLAAPITLVFNVLLWQSAHSRGLPRQLAFPGAILGLLVMLVLARYGIVFGIRGRNLDRDHGRSAPLAVAGTLVCIAAIILWLIVGIDLLFILF